MSMSDKRIVTVIAEEHVQTAQDFLVKSDNYFAEGDVLQGSEKLWGAAAHAVMAMAQERGWDYGSHYHLVQTVERVAEERNEEILVPQFGVAQKFHANFYHNFMEDFQLEVDRPVVHRFVGRILSLIDEMPEQTANGIVE